MRLALGFPLSVLGLWLIGAAREPRVASRQHVVAIKQFSFEPPELSISVGDTVAWVNADDFIHTSASDSAAWSSPNLAKGDRFAFVARAPGRFPYHCAAHPVMQGTLVVTRAGQ